MERVVERVYEALDRDFRREDEDSYSMKEPPTDFRLRDVNPGTDLVEGLSAQIDGIPLRWRLDIVEVIGSYIQDYGPSQRRYLRLLRRIQRERRAAG